MVKIGRRPFIFRMALSTIGWHLGGLVFGVSSGIVICLVTTVTSVRRVVVVAVVACGTLICNGGMSTIQSLIIIVVWESRWQPLWFCGMALSAISW